MGKNTMIVKTEVDLKDWFQDEDDNLADELKQSIIRQVLGKINSDKSVESITQIIQSKLSKIVDEKIDVEITNILTKKFYETDNCGNKTQLTSIIDKVQSSLSDYVKQKFNDRGEKSYDGKYSRVDLLAKETASSFLKKLSNKIKEQNDERIDGIIENLKINNDALILKNLAKKILGNSNLRDFLLENKEK